MSSRLAWLLVALFLSLLVTGFHLYNLAHDAYFFHWWLDIPMHIMGGAALGSFFIALSPTPRPLLFLAAMIAVSVGWELFEYIFGMNFVKTDHVFDTSHDLLDDAIGALLVYSLARKTIWR